MGCGGSKDQSSASDNNRKPLTIRDASGTRAASNEEPATPIPAGEFEGGNLGVVEPDFILDLKNKVGEGELFEDPDFATDADALFYNHSDGGEVTWKRPKDLVEKGDPYLKIDGATKHDVQQGELGDCWFLSSCAAVAQQEKYMKKIIPDGQPLFGSDYKGLVHFRFWRFGKWIDVVIDDCLPTRDDHLIYAHCSDPNEFWVALLEKAYAKLHGSYQAIEGGQTMDALVDMTGGLAERYEITEKSSTDRAMFKRLLKANTTGAFITCSKKGNWKNSNEADENGLVAGHAYTVTRAALLEHAKKKIALVRIRNPWGNEIEWNGEWSDNDPRWKDAKIKNIKDFNEGSRPDGEFWMTYTDFCDQFASVTICNTGPDFDGDGSSDPSGYMVTLHGEWVVGLNAGGCRNDLNLFSTNPQYLLTVLEPDDFDPEINDPSEEGFASIIIALMQEHRRSQRHLGTKMLQIGFMIYETKPPKKRLSKEHFMYNYELGTSGMFTNLREVCTRIELKPGHYVIIPSTFKPKDEATYMLRVFSQKKVSFVAL